MTERIYKEQRSFHKVWRQGKAAMLLPVDIVDSGESLVLLKGYLSDRDDSVSHNEPWWQAIRKAGWKGSIYQLWWDASTPYIFSAEVLKMFLIPGFPVLKAALTISEGVRHWRKVSRRAKRVGLNDFHTLLQPIAHEKLTLMGFSLGSLVLHNAVNQGLAQKVNLQKMIFLGGAVTGNTGDWDQWMKQMPNTSLLNVYNPNDYVLKYLFRFGQLPLPGFDTIGQWAKGQDLSKDKLLEDFNQKKSQLSNQLATKSNLNKIASKSLKKVRGLSQQGIDTFKNWDLSKLEQEMPAPCGLEPIPYHALIQNLNVSTHIDTHPMNHWRHCPALGNYLQF